MALRLFGNAAKVVKSISVLSKPRLFKRRKNILFVGSHKTSRTQLNRHMARQSNLQFKGAVNKLEDLGEVPRGKVSNEVLKLHASSGRRVFGTFTRGRKGKIVISRDAMRSGVGREVVHHETFHQKVPVLGHSEFLAHAYGGLRSQRTGLSFKGAARSTMHLIKSRPDRALIEGLGVAGLAAATGIPATRKVQQHRASQSRSEASKKAWKTRRRKYGQDGRR